MLQAIDINSVCSIAKRHVLLIAAHLAFAAAQAQPALQNPQLKTGFAAMYNMDQLPLLFLNGTQTRQPLAYHATGQNWDHHFLAAFTQYVDLVKMPDDGKAYNGSSNFTVKTVAANEGVKLRRRINRNGNGVQTARVYVDGKPVPRLWHIVIPSLSTGKGPVDGWYDSDFDIPAAFTKGKTALNIKVEYVNPPQQGSINEFYYWIYSYTSK